jgi:hypothetical protein
MTHALKEWGLVGWADPQSCNTTLVSGDDESGAYDRNIDVPLP